jgi:hypothetical protein
MTGSLLFAGKPRANPIAHDISLALAPACSTCKVSECTSGPAHGLFPFSFRP